MSKPLFTIIKPIAFLHQIIPRNIYAIDQFFYVKIFSWDHSCGVPNYSNHEWALIENRVRGRARFVSRLLADFCSAPVPDGRNQDELRVRITRFSVLRQALALITVAALSSCSVLSPPTTVTGTVRYHGKPVANADVYGY
jgi:hypothetical protein